MLQAWRGLSRRPTAMTNGPAVPYFSEQLLSVTVQPLPSNLARVLPPVSRVGPPVVGRPTAYVRKPLSCRLGFFSFVTNHPGDTAHFWYIVFT